MNWYIVLWVIVSLFLIVSALTWINFLQINPNLRQFIEWEFKTIFFMYVVPVVFVALLLGTIFR